MATKLSNEYNKATLFIAKTFLKNGLDVTLEREDSSGTDESAFFDGNRVKLNDNLFIITHASRDYPTKKYNISLGSNVPDYGNISLDKWELNIENPNSIKETKNKINGISKNIIEVREYGLDDLNHNTRSSVKLISNANKLDQSVDPSETALSNKEDQDIQLAEDIGIAEHNEEQIVINRQESIQYYDNYEFTNDYDDITRLSLDNLSDKNYQEHIDLERKEGLESLNLTETEKNDLSTSKIITAMPENIKYAVVSYTKEDGWEVDQVYDDRTDLPKKIGKNDFYEIWKEVNDGYKPIDRTRSIDDLKSVKEELTAIDNININTNKNKILSAIKEKLGDLPKEQRDIVLDRIKENSEKNTENQKDEDYER